MTCIKNGWSYDQIEELFKCEAGENTHFRDEGKNCYKWLKQTHKAMTGYYKKNPRMEMLEAFVEGLDFKGGSRYTDMEVSKLVLQMMRETGKMEGLSLSLAEVAYLAGIGISTASKSLKRLSDIWLAREEPRNGEIRYSVKKVILESFNGEEMPVDRSARGINNHGLDLFSKQGLGKTGRSSLSTSLNTTQARYLRFKSRQASGATTQ